MELELPRRQPLASLVAFAGSSGGILTMQRAGELGIDKKQLQRLTARGVLIREAIGVYRLAGAEIGLAARALAASARRTGVVSHQTAAQLWGYRGAGFDDDVVHLTVSHGSHPAPIAGVVLHATRRSIEGVAAERSGVRVTRPLRTIVDLSGQEMPDEQLLGFLDHCVAERLVPFRSLERRLSSKRPGVDGLLRLRRLVADLCEVDSVAEGELVRILVTAGIEKPITQFVVRDVNGHFLGRVDQAWPARKVALELDGYHHHAGYRRFVSDRERGNRIVAAGWVLLRTTPASMREMPHQVVADVRAAIERATAASGFEERPNSLPA